jgi:hypothetical protein
LNGRIRRLAECQGVAGIGNHTAGIALDGNRMIWTWKLDVLSAHAQPFRNCVRCSTNSSGYWYCAP